MTSCRFLIDLFEVRRLLFTQILCCTALLLLAPSEATSQSLPSCTPQQHKHVAKIEVWSLCAKVTDNSGSDLYYALFFLSGKMFMLSGNFAHYSKLSVPSHEYTHESSTAVPPFQKVRHDKSSLDEYIGGHSIRKDPASDTFSIIADFKRLRSRFRVIPKKPCISFNDIIGDNYEKRKFDWYLVPRCSVTVVEKTDSTDTLCGNGHFQQFWGKEGGANCDWMVLHLQSGYDMAIAHFPEDGKKRPWLPDDYIMISMPDGSTEKITAPTIMPTDPWCSAASGKHYPLSFSISADRHAINISIRALKAKQVKDIGGKEFWFGFGTVEGTLDGELQKGWAYIAPLELPGECD